MRACPLCKCVAGHPSLPITCISESLCLTDSASDVQRIHIAAGDSRIEAMAESDPLSDHIVEREVGITHCDHQPKKDEQLELGMGQSRLSGGHGPRMVNDQR